MEGGFLASSSNLMKRKGLEVEDDDYFPISSPPIKIRRLDAELPPITTNVASAGVEEVMSDVAPAPANEERAIVLYKPMDANLCGNSSLLRPGIPLRVSPHLIHGFKNAMFNETSNRSLEDELAPEKNKNLAMVPWVPGRATMADETTMDTEDTEGASMEIEEEKGHLGSCGAGQGEASSQQWLQHCMVPQPPPAMSPASPVMWSW